MTDRHPESDVLDTIDALVNESLERGGYSQSLVEWCEICCDEWHGTTNDLSCPGSFASAEKIEAFRAVSKPVSKPDSRQRTSIIGSDGRVVWSGYMTFEIVNGDGSEWLGTAVDHG